MPEQEKTIDNYLWVEICWFHDVINRLLFNENPVPVKDARPEIIITELSGDNYACNATICHKSAVVSLRVVNVAGVLNLCHQHRVVYNG